MTGLKKCLLFVVGIFCLLITSCNENYTIENKVESISIAADNNLRLVGNNIVLTAITNSGTSITNNVVFEVNGVAIVGNVYTSNVVGNFEVRAKYVNQYSDKITVTFHNGSETNFKKRVLVEDYTGTWCGYCPRVAYALNIVTSQNANVVPIAIHRASSNINSSSYDPYNFNTSELEVLLDDPGYPKGFINRKTKWLVPEDQNIQQVINATQGLNPKLGLALTTSVVNNTINLTLNAKFAKDFENLKVVVYILENGLVFNQKNYTTFYNGLSDLPNFQHNHVLRGLLTNLLGDTIDNLVTKTGKTFNKTYNISVPANIANSNNIEFVGFIIDQNGNTINVRKAGIAETQIFEEI